MAYIIELLGTERRCFVEEFSNTFAAPVITFEAATANAFSSVPAAEKWAKAYLPGYKYKITYLRK